MIEIVFYLFFLLHFEIVVHNRLVVFIFTSSHNKKQENSTTKREFIKITIPEEGWNETITTDDNRKMKRDNKNG